MAACHLTNDFGVLVQISLAFLAAATLISILRYIPQSRDTRNGPDGSGRSGAWMSANRAFRHCWPTS